MIVVLTQYDVERRLLDKRGLAEVEQHADAIVVLSSNGDKFQVKKIRALDMGTAKDAWFEVDLLPALVECTQRGYAGTSFEHAVVIKQYWLRVSGGGGG